MEPEGSLLYPPLDQWNIGFCLTRLFQFILFTFCFCKMYYNTRRLGGVVFIVLATGPEGRGFKPGRGYVFFKGDKNPQHTFLMMGNEAGSPMS
jgi:hypothetical protein